MGLIFESREKKKNDEKTVHLLSCEPSNMYDRNLLNVSARNGINKTSFLLSWKVIRLPIGVIMEMISPALPECFPASIRT